MSVDPRYTWDEASGAGHLESSAPGSLGWRVLVAVTAAVLLHLVGLWALGRVGLVIELSDFEWRSQSFQVAEVETLPETVVAPPEEEAIEAPPDEAAELLTEIEELLPELDDMEIDILPELEKPKVSLEPLKPALAGEEDSDLLEPVKAPEVRAKLEEMGRGKPLFEEVPEGRVVIEAGSVTGDIPDPDTYLRDAAVKGAGGLSEEGFLDGYTELSRYLNMDVDQLDEGRAALPSDLLFEFDSAELKQSARLGLMKLAILIDRNPEMYCILEGHTDLFGADAYNLALSRRRAQAVKDWLVRALRVDGSHIIVRAFGKTKAKVKEGTREEQALNRRVDILMRKSIPPEEPVLVTPKRAVPVEEEALPARPVEPLRARPVD